MSRKIEIANDLWAQKRNHIRADRKLKTGKNFFRDRGASKHVTALEHEDLLTSARKIRRVRETVVPSADHDCVVRNSHQFLAPSFYL
jgi:hypothetical protein